MFYVVKEHPGDKPRNAAQGSNAQANRKITKACDRLCSKCFPWNCLRANYQSKR